MIEAVRPANSMAWVDLAILGVGSGKLEETVAHHEGSMGVGNACKEGEQWIRDEIGVFSFWP